MESLAIGFLVLCILMGMAHLLSSIEIRCKHKSPSYFLYSAFASLVIAVVLIEMSVDS